MPGELVVGGQLYNVRRHEDGKYCGIYCEAQTIGGGEWKQEKYGGKCLLWFWQVSFLHVMFCSDVHWNYIIQIVINSITHASTDF